MTIQRRVSHPRRPLLGVRASVGSRGYWVGCCAEDYAGRERELERIAVARVAR